MTEDKLRKFVKELMEPVFDNLVNMMMGMYSKVFASLPDTMTPEQKFDFIKPIIESQNASINNGFASIDVNELKKQVEEMYATTRS